MSNTLSETISTLNTLIETCKDGQEGFRLAAEGITGDENLKDFLFSCSLQRSKFAGVLQNEVIAMGQPGPSETSTVTAALHRGWIRLQTVLTGNDNHAILAECERGEDSAVAEYKKAINGHHLSENLLETVQQQFQEVLATHNSVRGLRDQLASQKSSAHGTGYTASDFQASLQNKAQAIGTSATDAWSDTKLRTDDVLRSTEQYVRENPLPSILTALGVGFALGLLVRLLERPSRDHFEVPIPKAVQQARDYDYKAAFLPFLWPVVKFFSSNYAASRSGVQKAYKQASNIDVNDYIDPVVKRAKKMF